ncbi:MAG: NADH:flavin oxidoreductase, partial [Chloroflexota bacterium]
VVEEVRGQVGPEYLVGCRYLGSEDILREDGTVEGSTLDDARRIGVELARAGLDFLSISRGGKFDDAKQPKVGEAAYPYTGYSGQVCMPRNKKMAFGVNAYLAEGIRASVRSAGMSVPVIGTGKIVTFDMAEQMLLRQKMDVVGMARALLADPDLPRKWLAGEDDELRVCVFCPYCEEEDQHHRVVTCTLWPKDPSDRRKRLIPGVWRPTAAATK